MRLVLAFLAGFLSTLIFHQGFIALMHRVGAWPRPAYSMTPTWPFQIPQVISSAFWAGLWAVALFLLLRSFATGASYWLAWMLAGAVAPTLVALFVVLPLKGRPIADSLTLRFVVGALMVNGIWGLGTALLLRLFRRWA